MYLLCTAFRVTTRHYLAALFPSSIPTTETGTSAFTVVDNRKANEMSHLSHWCPECETPRQWYYHSSPASIIVPCPA